MLLGNGGRGSTRACAWRQGDISGTCRRGIDIDEMGKRRKETKFMLSGRPDRASEKPFTISGNSCSSVRICNTGEDEEENESE